MLNLLPLRFTATDQDKNTAFREVAAEARTKAYEAPAHSSIPFDALLEKLDIPRSATHSPLFQVWMDYRPFNVDTKDIDAARMLGRGPELRSAWPETVSHRISDIAARKPESEAVKDGNGNSLTYGLLAQRIQSISGSLVRAGVQQGSTVAVFQQPSVDWVCSLLAIWHAGGTYVPMDLRSSLPRLALVAKAAKPAAILYHAQSEGQVGDLLSSAALINISSLPAATTTTTTTESHARADTPAAVLFTSGSTGRPKGVVLTHSAFKNTIEGLTTQYKVGAERVLQQSAFTFDFSLDQILCGLVNGGSVYVVTKECRGDPMAIAKVIESEKITYTRATPSEYASWIGYGAADLMGASEWRFAWGGGELMPRSLRQSIEGLGLEGLKLYNSYGPAESITCTKTEIPYGPEFDEDDIPFIGNAYAPPALASSEGRTVYRTGDVGRLRDDGALLFHGRIAGDTQVKIRGMRVELEDVENTILKAAEGALHGAVVSVRGELLVAHVQFAPGQYTEGEQNAFLRSLRFIFALPVWMIPAIFVALAQIPVNPHGKADRAVVQALEIQQAKGGRTAEDLAETERTLVELWKEVIPDHVAGALEASDSTSFFELGGNSLLLVTLQIMINMRFNAKLSLTDLFGAVTLGAMAAKIETSEPADNIDWDLETALDRNLAEIGDTGSDIPVRTSGRKRVLVTGSTGFLGRRLVQRLAESNDVDEIHCVAVRPKQRPSGQVISDKVKAYTGDLAAPRLGLTEESFQSLSTAVDMIIHVGTSRSLLDAYQFLRGANLESTKTLVQLAAARRIPFHFISSGSVAAMTDSVPPTGGSQGYMACKRASEKYLTKAAAQLELPLAIHRVTVPPQGAAGETEEILDHFRGLSSQMQTAPASGDWQVKLDVVRVDDLARRMADTFTSELLGNGEVRHIDHQSGVSLDMEKVIRQITEGREAQHRTIPAVQWIAQARSRGLQWQITSMDHVPFGDGWHMIM
ncbi:Uu.00g014910.m01.CDS01 [Anthostomella pinea]|uniref:Uu.00g014910.m01.CDS01 n=1 Tax=Anthostomella pinea TaxID=933095 RepID=A0AAI8VYF5_9PEZI|nr:Uu.00g014910.m01.CDS01 [Anthostomella pinea]